MVGKKRKVNTTLEKFLESDNKKEIFGEIWTGFTTQEQKSDKVKVGIKA